MPSKAWEKLTAPNLKPARDKLLLGSVGGLHLAQTAKAFLRALETGLPDAEFLRGLGQDMLLSAWEEDPLDGPSAARLLEQHEKQPWLDKAIADAARAARDHWRQPRDLSYFSHLISIRDYAKITSYLLRQTAKEPENLFWRQKALAHAAAIQEPETAKKALDAPWPRELLFASHSIQAHIHLIENDLEQALSLFEKAARQAPLASLMEKKAEALFRMQDTKAALNLWKDVLGKRPWHTNLTLRLYDHLTGLDKKESLPPGQIAILIYSHNKAQDLEQTLTSLFQSELGHSKVYVLDNGSTDHTPKMLAAFKKRQGERLSIITLPVNIGAPSARNWLLHLPEVSQSDWCAYLDDDAMLPQNWLLKLGAAADAYPKAGVWGCRVCDFFAPHIMQNTDLHLLWEDTGQPGRMSFTTSNLHLQVLDFGQFSYIRPCATVTGCCHLFKTQTLLESGDFSLHLSPSQYDDLEHDLRLGAMRKGAVYQGHVRILHMKKTGKAGLTTQAEYGNSIANKHKVQAMHPPERIKEIMAWEQDAMIRDFMPKAEFVAREL
ncbi:MAG: glycosyltransferase [Thermodesulfobacteriota bacterium]|nr:glycosyltransferase [Thermodesulfobacteriota bacterium]